LCFDCGQKRRLYYLGVLKGDHNDIFWVNEEEYWKVLGEFIDEL
jgi:hypothetical protein